MAQNDYLKTFYSWRKAAGALLHEGREKRGVTIEVFLRQTGQDHVILQDTKIWEDLEKGRIRSRTKNGGDRVILRPEDYIKALNEFLEVYYFPEECSEEKKSMQSLIHSQPQP